MQPPHVPAPPSEGSPLGAWLEYLERLDPGHIELGLERVAEVARRLDLDRQDGVLVTEVAGTNGKGTVSTLIANALSGAGVRTGLYTSPHLHAFTERIAIDGDQAGEAELCAAFEAVERGREGVALTYFEYATLAALHCFRAEGCEALVLEVGLGGRCDAVAVVDADLAVITSIGLDHTQLLGDTIEQIAHEKAGIIKRGCKVVTGSMAREAQEVIDAEARRLGCEVFAQGRDFDAAFDDATHFTCAGAGHCIGYDVKNDFVLPSSDRSCTAAAVMALCLIRRRLGGRPFSDAVNEALRSTRLPGRMQRIGVSPDIILDVAHNVPAAAHLRQMLEARQRDCGAPGGRRIALMGMLSDKDIEGVCRQVADFFDLFLLSSLPGRRGAPAQRLAAALTAAGASAGSLRTFTCVSDAFKMALDTALPPDQVVVFGSFVTVAEALDAEARLTQ